MSETPVQNPDDGQDTVDPTPRSHGGNLEQRGHRNTADDPVHYGRGGAGHFDAPGSGGGGGYNPIF